MQFDKWVTSIMSSHVQKYFLSMLSERRPGFTFNVAKVFGNAMYIP